MAQAALCRIVRRGHPRIGDEHEQFFVVPLDPPPQLGLNR